MRVEHRSSGAARRLVLALVMCLSALAAIPGAAQAAKPANTALPAITGLRTAVTLTIATDNGTWTNSPTSYTYQWRRCTSTTAGCTSITGATNQSYKIVLADLGKYMRVIVTAKNASGSTSATSSASAQVVAGGTGVSPGLTAACAGPSANNGYAGPTLFSRFVDPSVGDQLYSLSASGLIVKPLLNSTGRKHNPAWSPDGTQIAYDCAETTSDDTEIYVANTDGTGVKRLTNNTVNDSDPTWSPDGTKIAFVSGPSGTSQGAIYSMKSTDGTSVTQLTTSTSDAQPAWGPSNKIAFTRCVFFGGCNQTVFVMDGNGTNQTQWVASSSSSVSPTRDPLWTPDGSFIVFSRQRCQSTGCSSGYQYDLYFTSGTGPSTDYGQPVNYFSDTNEIQPAWNPSGGAQSDSYAGLLFSKGNGNNRLATLGGTLLDQGYVDSEPATNVGASSWAGLGDYLIRAFQPILALDESEQWRPLDVKAFLGEKDGVGAPAHQLCHNDGTGCVPIASYDAFLTLIGDPQFSDGHIDVQSNTINYQSPNASCITSPVKDCNIGSATAIYVQPTLRVGGYSYLDYWWFYRYNDQLFEGLPNDPGAHEGDWEGMTVAPSADLTGVDFVSFAQHKRRENLLGGTASFGALSCDWDRVSCQVVSTPKGRRVWAFPASGSHATYGTTCGSLCLQSGFPYTEGDHGGEAQWGGNFTTFEETYVQRFRGEPWVNWAGYWGSGNEVQSPGQQTRFKCPASGNTKDANPPNPTGCAASRRPVARATALDATAERCATWLGSSGLNVAYCDPRRLAAAVTDQRLGQPGAVTISSRVSARRDAAPGVAQSLGRALRVGERAKLTGRLAAGAWVSVAYERNGHVRRARFRLSRPASEAVITVTPDRVVLTRTTAG